MTTLWDQILVTISVGQRLGTPSKRSPFEIIHLDQSKIRFRVGKNNSSIDVNKIWVDSLPKYFSDLGNGWLEIGASKQSESKPKSLDAHFKRYGKTMVASYVASTLEAASIADIDRGSPNKIRLKSEYTY